jgi:hypothetical protein
MNEQEVLKYAKKKMRCETCKHLKPTQITYKCEILITNNTHIRLPELISIAEPNSFGCIYWEEKE